MIRYDATKVTSERPSYSKYKINQCILVQEYRKVTDKVSDFSL